MEVDRERYKKGSARVPRIRLLQALGIRTDPVARGCVTPVLSAIVDIMGRGNTALHRDRVVSARASSAQAGGKNPDLVHQVRDGRSATNDPGFDTHVLPH